MAHHSSEFLRVMNYAKTHKVFTVADICRDLGIGKSKAHYTLTDLFDLGMLHRRRKEQMPQAPYIFSKDELLEGYDYNVTSIHVHEEAIKATPGARVFRMDDPKRQEIQREISRSQGIRKPIHGIQSGMGMFNQV